MGQPAEDPAQLALVTLFQFAEGLADRVKFLTMETGQIKVRARMCTVCGAVELIGDVAKLERIQSAASVEP